MPCPARGRERTPDTHPAASSAHRYIDIMETFDSTSNPVADKKATEGVVDAAPVVQALRDLSAADSVEEKERLMIAVMDAKIAKVEQVVEARLAQVAPAEAAARSFVARITEAPTNLHQSTIYFAAADPKDGDAGGGCGILAGVLMVVGQCMVAMGVLFGTARPACKASTQCASAGLAGSFCQPATRRCAYCGDYGCELAKWNTSLVKSGLLGGTNIIMSEGTNFGEEDDMDQEQNICGMLLGDTPGRQGESVRGPGYNLTMVATMCAAADQEVTGNNGFGWEFGTDNGQIHSTAKSIHAWCSECVTAEYVSSTMHYHLVTNNIESMGVLDKTAALFAIFVTALAAVGELKVRRDPDFSFSLFFCVSALILCVLRAGHRTLCRGH